jgi:hypothetical protein
MIPMMQLYLAIAVAIPNRDKERLVQDGTSEEEESWTKRLIQWRPDGHKYLAISMTIWNRDAEDKVRL